MEYGRAWLLCAGSGTAAVGGQRAITKMPAFVYDRIERGRTVEQGVAGERKRLELRAPARKCVDVGPGRYAVEREREMGQPPNGQTPGNSRRGSPGIPRGRGYLCYVVRGEHKPL